jgi:hypothetical protein
MKRSFDSIDSSVEEWEQRDVKLEDGLYRGLMRRGAGDELAAGCAESDVS